MMPQLERPKQSVASKPVATRRGDTPLKVMERAYLWFDAAARRLQAQLEALPADANPAVRAGLERKVNGCYLRAADVASKIAPFYHAKLTTHLVAPRTGNNGGPLILWRWETETVDDVLARARRETGLIIESTARGLSTDGGAVLIMNEDERNVR
jgi:hypothetical protein